MKKWEEPIISTLEVKETMNMGCTCSEARKKPGTPDGSQDGEGTGNAHCCHKHDPRLGGNGNQNQHTGNDNGGHFTSKSCPDGHEYCCCWDPDKVVNPELPNLS